MLPMVDDYTRSGPDKSGKSGIDHIRQALPTATASLAPCHMIQGTISDHTRTILAKKKEKRSLPPA